MAEDLGTWPPEQATVLLEALTRAGLTPRAKRTRGGVSVTVADSEAEQAHRTLVANMDTIARAARGASGAARGRRRPATPRHGAADERPLTTQRLNMLARPIGLLLVGFMVAALVPPLRLPVIIATVAGVIYLLGKQSPERDD